MDKYFRPSYNGEEKKMVWCNLQIPVICSPPLILEDLIFSDIMNKLIIFSYIAFFDNVGVLKLF